MYLVVSVTKVVASGCSVAHVVERDAMGSVAVAPDEAVLQELACLLCMDKLTCRGTCDGLLLSYLDVPLARSQVALQRGGCCVGKGLVLGNIAGGEGLHLRLQLLQCSLVDARVRPT